MHEDLELLEAKLGEALEGLNASQTQLRPKNSAGKWTIQQVVDHLQLSYQRTCEVLDERLEKGRATRTEPSLVQRIGQFAVIKLGWFPPGRKAPPAVMPCQPATFQTGDELKEGVHERLSQMNEATVAAEKLFGTGRCASHIVLGPLAISQWRRFHLVHGRHHVKQIRRIRHDHSV